jgi:hypothetical protein
LGSTTIYGSVFFPATFGSGSGNDVLGYGPTTKGFGGGIIRIFGGTFDISGNVIADGNNGYRYGSGGAGGSIFINVTSLLGSGTISANGGDQAHIYAGGGGGGRIAIYYSGTNTHAGTVTANAGAHGGYGEPAESGTIITIEDSNVIHIDYNTVLDNSQSLSVYNNGSSYLFDTLLITAQLELRDNVSMYGTLLDLDSGTLTCDPGYSQTALLLEYTQIDIGASSNIDFSGCGYARGFGPGAGDAGTSSSQYSGGGAHASRGGDGRYDLGGTFTYGSEVYPHTFGSGSGNDVYASSYDYRGFGGGIVRIYSTTLTVNGGILANGSDGDRYGSGGAGGSIYINTETFTGSGSVTAGGGKYDHIYGSGGSGGRVAVYNTTNTFSGVITADAGNHGGIGSNPPGVGTVVN